MTVQPLRIAIVGGGIAGAVTWIALQHLIEAGLLEIAIFDAASALREVGASIAVQSCGVKILHEFGFEEGLERIGYRGSENGMIYRNYRTAEAIHSDPIPHHIPETQRIARFFRPHFHNLLLSRLPLGLVQLKKRLLLCTVLSGEDADGLGRTHLEFTDGSSWRGDLVIGADGIRSIVRDSFYPDFKLRISDSITIRGVFPIEHASDPKTGKLDELLVDSAHWWGPDRRAFTTPLQTDLFTLIGFVPLASVPANIDLSTWDAPFPSEFLDQFYPEPWNPSIRRLFQAATKVEGNQMRIFPEWHGDELESLVPEGGQGRVVLVGDAGHPHGGAFAAGGGLAVEDAYTLALSIAHILKIPGPPISNLSHALDLYNRARLPHVNKVVRAANGMRSTVKGRSWSDEEILAAVGKVGINELDWLAENPTKQVWEDVVNEDQGTKA